MPRKFHRKSRFGCTECRRRRIKCDEAEPICGRCVRTRSKCQYPAVQPSPEPPPSASNASESPSTVPWAITPDMSADQLGSFDLLDMMLMHRYSTDTCKNIFVGVREIHVWRHYIPALASSNVVLLHGILAITAIHYAWKEPARCDLYRTRALHHHALGLPKFQQLVASASSNNAEVIIAYAILLSLWMYASPEIMEEKQSLDDILRMVDTVRTSRRVAHLYRDIIVESPMSVFLQPPFTGPIDPALENSSAQKSLQSLHDQIHNESDKRATHKLQMFLNRYITGNDYNRLAGSWMASIDDEYWTRLRDHEPHAVLVFAYSTLLVRASEHECWWISGWSERILQACSAVLSQEEVTMFDWADHERSIRAGADELADIVALVQGKGG